MKGDPTDDEKTKGAAPFPENAPFENQQHDDNKSLKWRTTLSHLLRGPRHRFDAERWGDHTLHSTVSTLQKDYGLQIDREWRKVQTRFGTHSRVRAYWIAEFSRNHAMRLVARRKRTKGGGEA